MTAAPSLAGWHPVAASHALADGPLAARVLDDDLVLWRDADGRVAAALDRCPHRGTRLSLGTVRAVEGGERRLECPYHGWQFAADGRCARIPAVPDFAPGPAHALAARDASEAHGLVWVRTGAEDGSCTVPALDGAAALPPRRIVCGPYDVAAAAPRVVENFLDMSHFAFVHDGSLGERSHAAIPAYGVDHDAAGRPGVADYRAWQPRATHASTGGAWVRYAYRVLTPYAAVLAKAAEDAGGERTAILLATCPLAADRTRVWFTVATTDTASDDAAVRRHQDAVFAEDRPILESQRPAALPLAPGAEAHSAADRLATAYRRWLAALGARVGTLGP